MFETAVSGNGWSRVSAHRQSPAWLFVIALVALDAVLAVTAGGGLLAGQLTRLRGRLSTEIDDATPSRSDGTIPTIRGASGGGGLRCESLPGVSMSTTTPRPLARLPDLPR